MAHGIHNRHMECLCGHNNNNNNNNNNVTSTYDLKKINLSILTKEKKK